MVINVTLITPNATAVQFQADCWANAYQHAAKELGGLRGDQQPKDTVAVFMREVSDPTQPLIQMTGVELHDLAKNIG